MTDPANDTTDPEPFHCEHGIAADLICDLCDEDGELTAETLANLDGGQASPDDDDETDRPAPAYETRTDLPDFEGQRVHAVATRLAATSVTAIDRALHYGDTVILVLEAKLDDIGHPRKDGEIHRAQKLTAVGTPLEIVDRTYGQDLLARLRLARLRQEDAQLGRTAAEIKTTAEGIVLTQGDLADAELPELPPQPAADDEVVVVFRSGHREMWPDDFPADAERPKVGDRIDLTDLGWDTGDPDIVVELLDPIDGRTIAELDPERAAELEAALDREATEALEAGRARAPEPPPSLSWKKDHLIDEARRRGLDPSGTKDEILGRIEAHIKAEEV